MTNALRSPEEPFFSCANAFEPARASIPLEENSRGMLPRLLPFEGPGGSNSAPKVLYIEDNAENMLLVRRVMRLRPAIKLLEAGAGVPGLAMAYEQVPDLVVLDLNLPDINGDEVLRQLLADPRTAAIPVIILSGDCHPEQLKRLLAAGARDYITKPFELRRFLATVDGLLGGTFEPQDPLPSGS